ncbi:MAG: ribosome small subunit-dependent GTPase A, partial [Melioribacteraceae bacterium]|nr:ribosome small subunit-dependent GTPase A [Melioribacteraceae bacterium]
GKFRLHGFKITNPVAVGDYVELERENGNGLIKQILPRKNYVVRQSPRKKHQLHLLASNIDQALLIVTIIEPKLKQGFIDRFLLMTEPYDIPVIIIFNKSDLHGEEEMNIYEYLNDIYTSIGYTCVLTSAVSKEGIEKISKLLKNKVSLIAGQSGVGKSSILNAIQPDFNLKTASLSDYSGKGQHTTTYAEMFSLKNGGFIIDTPGIKTLSFNHLEVMDVAHNFREFFELSQHCKFGDCTHRDEPSCAVKKAIENHEISELRYWNYIQILDEIEEQNYWELHKDY